MKSLSTLLFFLLCACCPLFAQTAPPAETEPIYELVEQMPLFKADCPAGDRYVPCAQRKMLEYVYGNVKYPKRAHKKKAQGMVVATFIVEKDGTVSLPSIYRDQVGHGAAEEVLRIVRAMNEDGPAWEPGRKDGRAVRVLYKLPVKFKLS